MGFRNLLILFLSTVAVSLVILIIFFSLFFKNVDLSFDTHIPEAAPDLSSLYGDELQEMTIEEDIRFKAEGLEHSQVNVPGVSTPSPSLDEQPIEEEEPSVDSDDPDERPSIKEKEPEPLPPKPPALKPDPPKPPVFQIEEPKKTEPEPVKTNKRYQVYIGGFSSRDAAQAKADKLQDSGHSPFVKEKGSQFIVQLGVFSDKANAETLARQTGAKAVALP